MVARLMAERLAVRLKVAVVIENKASAKAVPDGYTLVFQRFHH